MNKLDIGVGTVIKLTIWSLIVGALLYWLQWSPGDVYGWIINKIAAIWNWLAGVGLNYLLVGATIVVPIYVLMNLKRRKG